MNCPSCGSQSADTGKRWKYRVFEVSLLQCEKCQTAFNVYTRNGKLSHTIIMGKLTHIQLLKKAIRKYFRKHNNIASEEELAVQLNLPIKDVRLALAELQQDGSIERVKPAEKLS